MANRAKIKAGKSMLLEQVPVDVQMVLLAKLADEEEHCKCTRSQDYALYKIVREWSSVFNSANLVVSVDGQWCSPGDVQISAQDMRIVVTFSLPITGNVGALLNYGRKEEGEK